MSLISWIETTENKYKALASKDVNAIYFLEDTGKIYKGNTCFSRKTQTPIFIVPNTVLSGLQNNIMLKIQDTGIIESITALCTKTGTETCQIDIEKISENDFEIGGTWSSIFESNNNIKIMSGKYSNSSSPEYILKNNIIQAGDILRLNIINNGNTISGLNLQIRILV